MVSAAKNAILPILAASMLSSGTVVIKKVPAIRDVHIMMALIQQMGLEVEHAEGILTIKGTPQNILPDYDLSRQIRASFLLMGPLLARCGQAKAFLPGGCAIGTRRMCYGYCPQASRKLCLSGLSQCRSNGKYYDGGCSGPRNYLHRKCRS
jgi:UDP-N-acetylglucosamine enolpyruvyl transferase